MVLPAVLDMAAHGVLNLAEFPTAFINPDSVLPSRVVTLRLLGIGNEVIGVPPPLCAWLGDCMLAEDAVAEDAVAEDAVAEDAVAEDAVAEDVVAEDVVAVEALCAIAEEAFAADATEAKALCATAEEPLAAEATAADTVCATAEEALAEDALRFSSAIALSAFLIAIARESIVAIVCIIDGLDTTPPDSGEYIM